MKVRVKRGFVTRINGEQKTFSEGQIFDLPKGVDWLKAGLVEKLNTKPKSESREKAAVSPEESR